MGCGSIETKEPIQEIYHREFDGIWQGVFYGNENFEYPRFGGNAIINLRVEIAGDKVKVLNSWRGKYRETKAGKFKIVIHKSNAIIYAIDSSKDIHDKTGSGGWVETWNITLTHGTTGSLYGTHVRAVNNYLLSPLSKTRSGLMSFSGVLKKVD